MKRLRLLKLNNLHVEGDYGVILKELRWLCWHGFPLNFLPDEFHMENMVVIDIRYGKLRAAWRTFKGVHPNGSASPSRCTLYHEEISIRHEFIMMLIFLCKTGGEDNFMYQGATNRRSSSITAGAFHCLSCCLPVTAVSWVELLYHVLGKFLARPLLLPVLTLINETRERQKNLFWLPGDYSLNEDHIGVFSVAPEEIMGDV
ncbi:hypothetical protein CRG98_031857 [Punica granatum]|uniref:Uncharacterized protein n=1 Tax=Punica granatum TaxID=22663 RepID=A0A2I0IUQ9_PUNGR|nr:hypothetical protein CRG98_031857 [Punica granatum]